MLHGAGVLDPNFALGGDKVPTGGWAMQRVSRRCAKRLVHRRTVSKIDALTYRFTDDFVYLFLYKKDDMRGSSQATDKMSENSVCSLSKLFIC